MRAIKVLDLSLFAAIILVTSISLFAQEKKITKKDVPVNVMTTFQKAYPKAVVKGTSIEKEHGKKYYEIESMEGSKHIDLLITSAGKITEIEETISTDQIPGSIMKTLGAKFKGLKVEKAEKVTHGSVSDYELVIESKSGKHEVKLNVAGKLLKTEKVGKETDSAD
ncbi:MAG TPA: PepSY-like domain-containing protein [Ignavibacteriaceae bacterium]|nr:PepSY-like domain-containing protein [Ignavibacteriaceae bacterium]